ncbi:MAG: V-type ATP synthase subunit F [Ruminococcaceae bacterium]|nr:V-type ATP synthase subunit F [Oscillospiraceae bacterium]
MYKIGMIGDRESTLCFLPLGFSVLEAETAEQAAKSLWQLAKSEEYAVIFITEDLALQIPEEIDRYKDMPLPAVTVIPGRKGGRGYGLAQLRKAVERAVGTDILK